MSASQSLVLPPIPPLRIHPSNPSTEPNSQTATGLEQNKPGTF